MGYQNLNVFFVWPYCMHTGFYTKIINLEYLELYV